MAVDIDATWKYKPFSSAIEKDANPLFLSPLSLIKFPTLSGERK